MNPHSRIGSVIFVFWHLIFVLACSQRGALPAQEMSRVPQDSGDRARRVEIDDAQNTLTAVLYGPSLRQLPKDALVMKNIEYSRTAQGPVYLDLYIPGDAQEARPLIVWIHGGGWHVEKDSRTQFIPARMVGRGYVLASISYRDSRSAPFPAQIQDCKAAIRYLRARAREYRIDPKRIGVWGISAGGHLSALLGTSGKVKELEGEGGLNGNISSSVQAVCDFCGPTDVLALEAPNEGFKPMVEQLRKDLLGGPPEAKQDLAKAASPLTYVDSEDPPFLIMHGDADPLVPLSQSEALYEALRARGVDVTLAVIKDGNHVFWGPEVNRQVDAFFDRHLKAGAPASAK